MNRRTRPDRSPRIEQHYRSPFSADLAPFDPIAARRAAETRERLLTAGILLLSLAVAAFIAVGCWL